MCPGTLGSFERPFSSWPFGSSRLFAPGWDIQQLAHLCLTWQRKSKDKEALIHLLRFLEWILDSTVWEPTSDITVKGVSCPETCQQKITPRLANCRRPPWAPQGQRLWEKQRLPARCCAGIVFCSLSVVLHPTKPPEATGLALGRRALHFVLISHSRDEAHVLLSWTTGSGSHPYFRNFVPQIPKKYCPVMASFEQVLGLPWSQL